MEQVLGLMGSSLCLGIAGAGVCLGMYAAASAAAGAAKRSYKANKTPPMLMISFVGFPLSQVIYGFIVMQSLLGVTATPENAGTLLGLGIGAGLAIGFSGYAQGKAGAAACDALADTGKGVALYIAALGIIESVALFAMVFTMINIPA